MPRQPLKLFTVFHLNLAYSSIEEEQRAVVIERCYWPLLRLASEQRLPLGIEATAFTLETAAQINPLWLEELRRLVTDGPCEFIGSGYAQIIGPLVPAEVNAANLRLGHQAYERLLGFHPRVALINEQAYSAGMVQHYLDAGYDAIVMEWENPFSAHPEWPAEWRYLPQIACGQHGEQIPLIWNKSLAFQKFQRYAHSEMELDEYLDYLRGHIAETPRAFPLYGNDVEVFDFRPGRFHTEAPLAETSEWERIAELFAALQADHRFQFIRPSEVLALSGVPGACNRLHLESAAQPIPVKKQGKYNITRWAVTGRDDLGINTACWRIYESLKANAAGDEAWKELCCLWSSDFRTHITETRWNAYLNRLQECETRICRQEDRPLAPHSEESSSSIPGDVNLAQKGNLLTVETAAVRVVLNCRRGLAIDRLWLGDKTSEWLCGTIAHGNYEDINWGADYYTGHLVFEAPGQPKITDLERVVPAMTYDEVSRTVRITAMITTPLGPIHKEIRVSCIRPHVEMRYRLEWESPPIGSLRLGHVTLNPSGFEEASLLYQTDNGGWSPETFLLGGEAVDHGRPVSFLVSARHAFGMTTGGVEMGDAKRRLRITVDKGQAALIGMLAYQQVKSAYFCRVAFSAREMDETSRIAVPSSISMHGGRKFSMAITASGNSHGTSDLRVD